MAGWVDRWMDGWVSRVDGWMDGWMEGWKGRREGGREKDVKETDTHLVGWVNGRRNGYKDG